MIFFSLSMQLLMIAARLGGLLQLNKIEDYGAPGAIRTPDLLIRSQMLYPTELRVHDGNFIILLQIRGGNLANQTKITSYLLPFIRLF